MKQLTALIVSEDEGFRKQIDRVFRSGSVPIKVVNDRADSQDVVIVDIRDDVSSAMASIERLRARIPATSILAVASAASPDLILQAMRSGANEFVTWPLVEDTFQEAIRRLAGRQDTGQGAKPSSKTLVFFGSKGGAGTTTVAVNCGVELARLSKRPTLIIDLKPGLGEVALFLGVRPRYTVLDAIDNLQRLDPVFLRQLIVEHKSGLGILAGSDHFDRPGAADSGAMEALLGLLSRQYEYVVVDAGSQINHSTIAAVQGADRIFVVANPDVPSVRNAQRLAEHLRGLGATGDRVQFLMNRAAEPYPIPLKQIESALGKPIHHSFPSDYKTVSTALNSGVPLALVGSSDIATQFDQFTRDLLNAGAAATESPANKRLLTFGRIASFW
jgi:pilus assembly protein CpaE